MKIIVWFRLGILYFTILFGTAIASLKPYTLESWLTLSAFLMTIWLILIGLIDKKEISKIRK